ncbi:Grg1 protein [Tilletiaria anomala UBC 951]|uniref:Grg1 protein n=1 Tax=Tilletiaria anomala (strain ATCC 24038 / CBS 436.72 / UBC 951) TaxID=1037660 RepID=A0A066VL09_TILAU|nr:Grg1 protein [Tilletiaria anomala UBC 951]KDN42397.1 Grg1 protein [Tilletiaria anomala UBC 951]
METVKNVANYVSESVQGAISQGSYETNKAVAKDSNASIGTRISAGVDAINDKIEQKGHEAGADLHNEAAKH